MLTLENVIFGGTDMPEHRLNFRVKRGEILVVHGPSGIGKTSLLHIIAGFLLPMSGHIYWEDQELTQIPVWQRPISFLFQNHNLFEHLSCRMNLNLGLNPSGKVTAEEEILINQTLDALNIAGLADRYPPSLSGGQQQRMALGRALIRKDPIILLDEPFSALDQDNKEQASQLICKIRDDYQPVFVIVSHDLADAARLDAEILHLS